MEILSFSVKRKLNNLTSTIMVAPRQKASQKFCLSQQEKRKTKHRACDVEGMRINCVQVPWVCHWFINSLREGRCFSGHHLSGACDALLNKCVYVLFDCDRDDDRASTVCALLWRAPVSCKGLALRSFLDGVTLASAAQVVDMLLV